MYNKPMWNLVFWADEDGSLPVANFIISKDDGDIAEITHVCGLLVTFNIKLRMPYVRKVHKSGLRELRIRHGTNVYRIFFFAFLGQTFVLLHAIQKKEDKLSNSDLAIALTRMENYKNTHQAT